MTGGVAIVTGGAKGIGRAILRRLIDDGMTGIVADIDATRELLHTLCPAD